MTRYLLAGLSLLVIAAVTATGVQSYRLRGVQSDLVTAVADASAARTERDQAIRDRQMSVTALVRERDRAVAAERRAATLREQIARDAGTDRDGPTAPTLKDAIEAITKTGGDVGTTPMFWRLTVRQSGHVADLGSYPDRPACVRQALAAHERMTALPQPGPWLIVCTQSRREVSA